MFGGRVQQKLGQIQQDMACRYASADYSWDMSSSPSCRPFRFLLSEKPIIRGENDRQAVSCTFG